ncbi:antitoxin [Marinactinospora thermotolerans]|uniref:MT0933-like antitoxin protein n=1 Tax=Marinactinospora thermotolerans DSM 45154 TaxID=1122192 RepID=A0A1T4T924_9ACTN|nr:antitoxin [Marinactinospora thermotolerans]SKA36995.1 MT0933-like antitoxin protein [Marinactinospora thermotolerans DSM 45154]
MAGLKGLLRQAFAYVRRNPHQVNRGIRSAGTFVKRRTGGRYNRQVDQLTSAADRYLGRGRRNGYGRQGHYRPDDRWGR